MNRYRQMRGETKRDEKRCREIKRDRGRRGEVELERNRER